MHGRARGPLAPNRLTTRRARLPQLSQLPDTAATQEPPYPRAGFGAGAGAAGYGGAAAGAGGGGGGGAMSAAAALAQRAELQRQVEAFQQQLMHAGAELEEERRRNASRCGRARSSVVKHGQTRSTCETRAGSGRLGRGKCGGWLGGLECRVNHGSASGGAPCMLPRGVVKCGKCAWARCMQSCDVSGPRRVSCVSCFIDLLNGPSPLFKFRLAHTLQG